MNDEVAYDRATVSDNGKFMLIDTWSGYYGSSLDPKGKHHVIPSDSSNEVVGALLLEALSASRVGTPDDFPDVYVDRDQRRKEYLEWIESALQRAGYKNKRALFKSMNSCTVHRRRSATIRIMPSVHDMLEGWVPLPEDQTVELPSDSSHEQIGAAVRVALGRCET